MKLEIKLLIIALIAGLVLRGYSLSLFSFIGNDPFLHASVIRQYLQTGNLDTYDLTGGINNINEPKGLYFVTILPALLGIPYVVAFQWMPIIFGIIAIILLYYFLKNVFNARIAVISSFLLALSVAHAYRTMANFYRGDGFFLTFFLGVMLTYILVLKQKELKKQLIFSGLSALSLIGMITVWNGHLLGIAIMLFWLLITQLITFYKGEKDITKKLLIYEVIVLPAYLIMNWVFLQTKVLTNLFFYTQGSGEAFSIVVMLPLVLSAIFYYSIKFKKKIRILILISLFGGALIFLGLTYSLVSSVLSHSIFFQSTIYTIGVSELLAPTFDLFWVMYNVSYYFMWPGLILFGLSLVKLKEYSKLVLLAYTIPVLFLTLSYNRYSFLGSLIAVVMTAIILDYGYSQMKRIKQLKKRAIILPISVIIIYTISSAQGIALFQPRISEGWVEELEWVGNNLEPGRVLSWWDHGSWIQYYTGFPTVVDSVYGQVEMNIQRVAKFLVSNNNDTFDEWNTTYLIIGNDAILYIGAILGLANETDYQVFFATQQTRMQAGDGLIDVFLTGDGQFELYSDGTLYRDDSGTMIVGKRIYVNESGVTELVSSAGNYTGYGCLIINPFLVFYADDKACESNLVKTLFGNGTDNYNFIHANDFVRVYEVVRG